MDLCRDDYFAQDGGAFAQPIQPQFVGNENVGVSKRISSNICHWKKTRISSLRIFFAKKNFIVVTSEKDMSAMYQNGRPAVNERIMLSALFQRSRSLSRSRCKQTKVVNDKTV